jgi:tRNA (adenine22-N1)-methyltransferase
MRNYNMQLSKRLQAVADLVTPGSRVADVGCDHAYISIYLAENNISSSIIALDINKGPLDRAKANINKYSFNNRIETRLSNGMAKLKPGESDCIVIAGMGGALTVNILSESLDIMQAASELVLQPQSEIHKVRQLLKEQGFVIVIENMVFEDGKYYTMMKAIPASLSQEPNLYTLKNKEHFYYGRLLLENQHPVLKSYLLWDMELCEGIIKALENENTDNASERMKQIKDRIKLISCGLEYYNR